MSDCHHGGRNSNLVRGVHHGRIKGTGATRVRTDATLSAGFVGRARSEMQAERNRHDTVDTRWQRYAAEHGIEQTPASMIEWHGDDGVLDGTASEHAGYGRPDMDSDVHGGNDLLTLAEGGDYLGITGAALKRVILKENVSPDGKRPGKYGNVVSLYSIDTLERVAETAAFEKELTKHDANRIQRMTVESASEEHIAEARERVASRIHVSVRQRTNIPTKSILYIGPTNSGKSYHAIEELVSDYERNPDGLYVYAGPLRMLAYEVYEKLCDRIGINEVGFVTGEEQINQDAHIRCCTVEMAPMEGTSLVLDEAHWMTDPDRGQYWTNLLVGGEYDSFYVIAAAEAEPAVASLLSDTMNQEIVHCSRLTPLEFGGTIGLTQIPPRSAVVAFSRRGVYDIARDVSRSTGMRCGVLYGALPLDVRREQIERYVNGEYDVMATTDVIGHGINLPIDNVVFAQTDKFDGVSHRNLYLWEAAQIAGRAGRYGMTDIGHAYAIEYGLPHSGAHCSADLVQQATLAACGTIPTDLAIDKALVTPRFGDLGVSDTRDMMLALDEWSRIASERLSGMGITAAPMRERKRLLSAMAGFAGAPVWPWSRAICDWALSPELVWSLSGAPLDPDGEALYHIVCWASDAQPETSPWLEDYFDMISGQVASISEWDDSPQGKASDLERAYSSLMQLKMINVVCGTLGTLSIDDVEALIDNVSAQIGIAVSNVGNATHGNRADRRKGRRRNRRKAA